MAVTKVPIDPIPEEPIPIKLLLLVHSYCVPISAEPEKLMVAVNPLQISMGVAGETTTEGVGFTVKEKVLTGPLQVLENGVTVKTD